MAHVVPLGQRPIVHSVIELFTHANLFANARQLAQSGAAQVIRQDDFTPQRLAQELRAALDDEPGLARRAQAAGQQFHPITNERLARAIRR